MKTFYGPKPSCAVYGRGASLSIEVKHMQQDGGGGKMFIYYKSLFQIMKAIYAFP